MTKDKWKQSSWQFPSDVSSLVQVGWDLPLYKRISSRPVGCSLCCSSHAISEGVFTPERLTQLKCHLLSTGVCLGRVGGALEFEAGEWRVGFGEKAQKSAQIVIQYNMIEWISQISSISSRQEWWWIHSLLRLISAGFELASRVNPD